MARVFVYDDREFPDPDPQMSVDQVKATLSDFYGEIANASVKETKRGDDTIYEFQRRVGTKGAFPTPKSKEGIRWTTAPLPVCWRQPRLRASASLSSRRSSHGPTAPSTWTPPPPGSRTWSSACVQAQDYAAATGRLLEALRWQLRPRRN